MFLRKRRWARFTAVWGILALNGLGLLACSTPNTINPADAARVRKIDATVEQIRQAYANKDAAGFRGLLMPLESLRRLESDVQRDFAAYDQIKLEFAIDRVMVDGADVAVFLHWQGQWEAKNDAQPLRERGHAVIRLVGQQSLTLSGVDGDVPFGMAARRFPGEPPRGR
jgi:hypothetical protein